LVRLTMESRATAPMDGSASPRKPIVTMCERSSLAELGGGVAFDGEDEIVGLHALAVVFDQDEIAAAVRGRDVECVAPASSAFSISSFTALAGRSTTSPAAMRLTVPSETADFMGGVIADSGALRRIRRFGVAGGQRPRHDDGQLFGIEQAAGDAADVADSDGIDQAGAACRGNRAAGPSAGNTLSWAAMSAFEVKDSGNEPLR
jgi:hypothetical protein